MRFLFSSIRLGYAFLRSASLLSDPVQRAEAASYAQTAHDAVVRLATTARLTTEESSRLQRGLIELAEAVAAWFDRETRGDPRPNA